MKNELDIDILSDCNTGFDDDSLKIHKPKKSRRKSLPIEFFLEDCNSGDEEDSRN